MKNLFFYTIIILLAISCSEKIEFEDTYPNANYLEIKFCSYTNNASVSDLSNNLRDLSDLNDSYFREKSLFSYYLDPLFERETYDFIWFNVFKSKLTFMQYDLNLKKEKKFIVWEENLNQKVSCNSEGRQFFYNIFENNIDFNKSEKLKKNINFCKYLPNVNLYDLQIYFNDSLSSSAQIKILIPETKNNNFDFVIEENRYQNLDISSAASQMGFLASCNEEISDSFSDGLNFDSYPIYSPN